MNEETDRIEVKIEGPEIPLGEELKNEIIKNHLEPSYREDIISLIDGRKCWRVSGQVFETISKVCVAIGSVVSFAAGYYDQKFLSFISGAISVFSLAALQFSTFSYKENKKQSQELNILLKKLKIDSVPILGRAVDSTLVSSGRYDEEKVPLQEYNHLLKEFEDFKREAYQRGNELTKEIEMMKEKEIIKNNKRGIDNGRK